MARSFLYSITPLIAEPTPYPDLASGCVTSRDFYLEPSLLTLHLPSFLARHRLSICAKTATCSLRSPHVSLAGFAQTRPALAGGLQCEGEFLWSGLAVFITALKGPLPFTALTSVPPHPPAAQSLDQGSSRCEVPSPMLLASFLVTRRPNPIFRSHVFLSNASVEN